MVEAEYTLQPSPYPSDDFVVSCSAISVLVRKASLGLPCPLPA